MNGKSPPPPAPGSGDSAGALVLERSIALLQPLVRLLVEHGVGYPAFAAGLRAAFIEAARAQLLAQGARVTDAAISVRSGVHRKEVRVASAALARGGTPADAPARAPDAVRADPAAGPAADAQADAQADVDQRRGAARRGERRSLSLAEQVFTRWTTDAAYRDRDGRPAVLPLGGAAPSFESLAASITRDVSRRTVLAELVRIGLVEERGDSVVPLADAVVPKAGFETTLRYLSDHVHDHLAAAAANLGATTHGAKPPFLEHSLYANGLSDESIAQLSTMARTLWRPSFERMTDAARQRFEIDRAHGYDSRFRVGIYVYAEPAGSPARADDASIAPGPGGAGETKGSRR
ncbi:MAG: DUF6502 family protein [Lautropia sp.]